MNSVRPTKKQRELLEYIGGFITEHGYSPSYREIMNGLNYTSVATVAVHVNNLIRRGHLRKRENAARSLEVVDATDPDTPALTKDWLLAEIDNRFEAGNSEELEPLVRTLEILGLPQASDYRSRYDELVAKNTTSSVTGL